MSRPQVDSRTVDFRRFAPLVQAGPRPLFATISGAHLYGFASADSDVDIRGAFVRPLDDVLGLGPHRETWEVSEVRLGLEVDWVAHDVHKFVTLMTRKNGYVLEQLYSPLVVHGGPWLDELKDLGRLCIHRELYYHYRGFYQNQLKLMAKGKPTAKAVLYAYRVLLTGMNVLKTGRIEANLSHLLQEFPQEGVAELVVRKVEGTEKAPLEESLLATHLKALERLESRLDQAKETSSLPEKFTEKAPLSDFVVRARRELGDD